MRFEPPAVEDIPSVDALVASMDRTVSGLLPTKRRLALTLHRFMVAAANGNPRPRHNVLMLGPSGGGKTHIVRALLEACPVVWAEVDATAFSDVGYVGRDLTSMYLGLLEPRWRGHGAPRAKGQPPPDDAERPHTQQEMVRIAERWGVVVIDEIDKINAPARPKEGERQVGQALQAELLKLSEGVETLAKRNDEDRGVLIATHNILHIAVGAFQGLNARVARRENPEIDLWNVPPNAYMKTTIYDVINYGFKEELVGRFATIVTLPPLESGHIARIFREHVLPDFERQCTDDGLELIVEEGAVSVLAAKVAGLPIGARALGPMLDDCLAPQWALAQPGDRLRVTAESVLADTAVLERAVAA